MRRFERLANELLRDVRPADLSALLDTLPTSDLVAILAGVSGEDDAARYRRNVVATALLNRVGAEHDLLTEVLVPHGPRTLEDLTSALARALRADMACVDEVDGAHFNLHGKHGLPEGMRETERCRQSSMALCEAVLRTGATLSVEDIPADPAWSDAPAWRKFGIRSYAAAPAPDAEGRVATVVWVASYRARAFSADELFLLERVAQRIALDFPRGAHPYRQRQEAAAAPGARGPPRSGAQTRLPPA